MNMKIDPNCKACGGTGKNSNKNTCAPCQVNGVLPVGTRVEVLQGEHKGRQGEVRAVANDRYEVWVEETTEKTVEVKSGWRVDLGPQEVKGINVGEIHPAMLPPLTDAQSAAETF